MGNTPNVPTPIEQAPDNSWWSVSGTYPDGSEFSGAVAFVTHDHEGQPVFDVVLGPDWRAVQYGRRAETITGGWRFAFVDFEQPERLAKTSADLEAARFVIRSVRAACDAADRTAVAQTIVEQIEALLPPQD